MARGENMIKYCRQYNCNYNKSRQCQRTQEEYYQCILLRISEALIDFQTHQSALNTRNHDSLHRIKGGEESEN